MMSNAVMDVLLATTLAGSGAIVLVMALRGWVGSRFGARVVYLLWAMVPIAQLAVLLPARVGSAETMPVRAQAAMMRTPVAETALPPGYESILVFVWITGALAMLMLQVWQQRRFRRWLGPTRQRADGLIQASVCEGLPAVVGLMRPHIVVPADFDQRYDAQERQLVLEHECVHLRRGDLRVNAVMAVQRCLYWFNPLVHLAEQRFRHDQEVACDQAVIARFPQRRRRYGDAMLKTQLAARGVPLACHWNAHHSLKERIAMLKRPLPDRRRTLAGKSVALLLTVATAAAAWAAQSPRPPSDTAQGALPAAQASTQSSGAPIFSVASLQAAAAADGGAAASHLPAPRYPAEAAEQGISGRVLLKILVGADGKAEDVRVEESQPAGVFDAISIEAARRWTFPPKLENGKAVQGWVRVPIDFDAGRKPSNAVPAGSAQRTQGDEPAIADTQSTASSRNACGTAASTDSNSSSVACGTGHALAAR